MARGTLPSRLVEVRVEGPSPLLREAGDPLELLARRGDDRLRRAEVLEQRALAGGADAGQLVEQRGRHGAVAAGAVVRDREAVGLVAYALEELQRGRVVAEDDRS